MKRGCRFSFHVCVIVAAIVYIYFSTVFIFIDQWFGLGSSPGLLNAAVFTCLALMCVYTYALAIFTDPGRIPASYVPDVEDADTPMHEIKRKGGDLRYCQKCALHKPPRAHHCRVCNRCVLRMVCLVYLLFMPFLECPGYCLKVLPLEFKDHHCVWLNNCVGHANYKTFFIFIVYAVVSCIYSLVLLCGSLTVDMTDEEQNEGFFRAAYVISGLLLVPLTLALTIFMFWHVYLILQYKTTIEYHEGVRAMWLAEKGGYLYSHPYDLGAYENMISVLGPNIFCWVCPTSEQIGSGLRFRTGVDKLAGTSF
ncbi:probable protein S-acyltransferase 16 isoform X1 [Coffea arabica]|uniref:S-acyltransferase n=1 Tax=Coffea arabica TaxID=13443 RepID=A0A6P6T207_COFAR|nr:probable protein S-acyltransferase 16 isoform X1 [Coffea arabica]